MITRASTENHILHIIRIFKLNLVTLHLFIPCVGIFSFFIFAILLRIDFNSNWKDISKKLDLNLNIIILLLYGFDQLFTFSAFDCFSQMRTISAIGNCFTFCIIHCIICQLPITY